METHALELVEHHEVVALERNPAAVYLSRLADSGARTMRQALNVMARELGAPDAEHCPWGALRFQHTAALDALLRELNSETGEPYSLESRRKFRAALRGVLKAAWRLGYMDAEEYMRAVDLPPIKGQAPDTGRELSERDVQALARACAADETAAGVRDAALLALGLSCGLRRSELVALNVADVDLETYALTVRGKGDRARLVYPANGALDALADWLAVRGAEPGPLFWPVSRWGVVRNSRLHAQAVYNLCRKRAEQAGLKETFSPHDLRRTFVSRLLDAGADLAVVSQMAGHASLETTRRYDKRGERAKQAAAALLHFPYKRRSVP